MIIRALYNYYISDTEAIETGSREMEAVDGEIYEVIRITDGIPLFMEDHTERFFNSARLAGLEINISSDEIERRIGLLIKINHVSTGNIRFSYHAIFRAFFIQHKYPSEKDYRDGIHCALLHRERSNPQAKTLQENVRGTADQLLSKGGFHEVLLVDHNNHITEGSRSNLFFIKNGCFYTPSSSDVLPGTTRKRIIALIGDLGLPLTEQNIGTDELQSFEAAYITGTSPGILPIRKIENQFFDVDNRLMRDLMNKYNQLVNEYLHNKQQ
jgi:branched-chain amino acid aminotransferase